VSPSAVEFTYFQDVAGVHLYLITGFSVHGIDPSYRGQAVQEEWIG
jgi:hypothetical protein